MRGGRKSRWRQCLVWRFIDHKIRRTSRYRSAIILPKKLQDSSNPAALIGDVPEGLGLSLKQLRDQSYANRLRLRNKHAHERRV